MSLICFVPKFNSRYELCQTLAVPGLEFIDLPRVCEEILLEFKMHQFCCVK